MAKTSALTAITENTSGDLLYVSQSGTDRAITIDNFGIQGTFTATLTAATPPTTPPTTTANYRIVGNWCDLEIDFNNVDTSGGSGVISITGLPAAITPVGRPVGAVYSINSVTSTLAPVAHMVATNVIYIRETDVATDLNIIAGTGKYLRLSISYRI